MAPKQKPGRSKQTYCTPIEFIHAIQRVFHVGAWAVDLAATAENRICPVHLGPGSARGENALLVDWGYIDGDRWMNPPFENIEPWAKKAALHRKVGRTFMLVPASVGSNWYAEHVHGVAHVVALSPRITFVGETAGYPKDLMLLVWGAVEGGFSTWRWKP
jgi:phage N-6-adenine-methyltransferase